MKFSIEQFSAINAAVANLGRAFSDQPIVPAGALNKYATAAGVRSMNVFDRDGVRMISINNGLIEIEVGASPGPVQPTAPTSGAGTAVELLLRKVA